jgi:hypothetical protein
MHEIIFTSGQRMKFRLLRRVNVHALRLSVHPGGEVRVSAPKLVPLLFIKRFLRTKQAWVEEHVRAMVHVPKRRTKKEARERYLAYKEDARSLVMRRLEHFNHHYAYTYQRISIRDQHTRWGSCSRKGNLNFNYRIVFLPPALADYVIVHELCHLKEFNHSDRFWNLIAEQVPHWQESRTALHAHKHSFNEKTPLS